METIQKSTWFEVYKFVYDESEESTETIATFDTLEEAEYYVSQSIEKLFIDEWDYSLPIPKVIASHNKNIKL